MTHSVNADVRREVLLCAFPLIAMMVISTAAAASNGTHHITIQKSTEGKNPTLAITEFRGPKSIKERFVRILRTADWFKLVSDAKESAYQLRAGFMQNKNQAELEFALNTPAADGAEITADVSRSGPKASHQVLYRAVDTLIERVFDQPGPCVSRIAFVAPHDEGKEVFSSTFDLSDIQQLTNNASISTEPSWGSEGRYLVYTLYRNHRTHIVLSDIQKDRQRVLVSGSGLKSGADLDRKNNRLVLSMSTEGQVDLFIKDLKKGRYNRLTRNGYVESSPCWSPDKKRICYVSDISGSPQLYVIPARGGQSQVLVNEYAQTVSPDWSEVSGQVIFSARHEGQYVLAKITPGSGEDPQIVISEPGDWESPSWGPDGRHVICTHTQANQTRIVIVDTRHGTVIPLTKRRDFALPVWTKTRTR